MVDTKKRLSAFYPTDLDFLLRNMGVKRLVLNGCMTDCCVLNTAFEASNMGYRVTVARDLVCGTNPDMEDAALKIVSLHLASWPKTPTRLRRVAAADRRRQCLRVADESRARLSDLAGRICLVAFEIEPQRHFVLFRGRDSRTGAGADELTRSPPLSRCETPSTSTVNWPSRM